jgi:spore coat polysaccharide biosynthesis protein SpsF
MTPRVVAIIQARMGSSRLPGKVLLAIEGEAMLARVVERTSRAKTVDAVLVATTTDPADDVVAAYCEACGITLARGSLYDVLDRYYLAASSAKAEIVVRITADCPLIDPQLIDDVVCTLLGASRTALPPSTLAAPMNFDFAANRLPPPWKRTYPIGLDTEACTFAALERAWKDAREPQEREHVMPYLYEEVIMARASTQLSVGISPRGFRIALLDHVADLGSHRWTVDTAEDLEFVREVYRHFHGRSDFSWLEVLELLRLEPRLLQINADVKHKSLRDVDPRARRAGGLH